MKNLVLIFVATLMVTPAFAEELATVAAQKAISQITRESQSNGSILQNAERDAAEFTFSDGTLRGEDLQKAFAMIRREKPRLKASDMDIAIAIVQSK